MLKEKGTTEDEMVGRYHRLNEHEFEQALGVGDAIQPSLPLMPFSLSASISPSIQDFSKVLAVHIR